MTPDAQVALITGLATVGSLAVGTVLGWYLNQQAQARNERREAVIQFVSAIEACYHAAVQYFQAKGSGRVDVNREVDRLFDLTGRKDAALSIAILTLPASFRPLLMGASTDCDRMYLEATQGEMPKYAPSWTELIVRSQKELRTRP